MIEALGSPGAFFVPILPCRLVIRFSSNQDEKQFGLLMDKEKKVHFGK